MHLLWYVHGREIPGRDTLRLICFIITVDTLGLICIIINNVKNFSVSYRSYLHISDGYRRGIRSLMWLKYMKSLTKINPCPSGAASTDDVINI